MMRSLITGVAFLFFCSCSNNGAESSRPDPALDSAATKTVNGPAKDTNASQNAGRMGDSTGTRSPNLSKDSLRR